MRASRLALTILALCFIGFVALFSGGFAALGQTAASFAAFWDALWPEAAHECITRPTFDVAFAGLTPDPNVLAAMRREPEYGKPMGAYLASWRNGRTRCAQCRTSTASIKPSWSASG